MSISDEVAEEIEALQAIFGDDALTRISTDKICMPLSPDPDCEGHRFGVAQLEVTFPMGYPAEALPRLSVSCGPRLPQPDRIALQTLADQTAEENSGTISIFLIANAIKEWLQEHTCTEPTPPPTPPAEEVDGDSGSVYPNDFDVDSEDLDDEMIQALKEVLVGDSPKLQELREIKKMLGKEQRCALRGMLRKLTPSQRDALVGSDSESNEEEAVPIAKAAAKAAVKLPPAIIECSAGHELTAYSSRPPDYKKFDDGDYTCDVCGQDDVYKRGVYHCTKCFANGGKQFDACPSCGIASNSGGKKQKNKGKKK